MIGQTGQLSTPLNHETERAVLAALARLPIHFWSHACTQSPPAEVEHWLRHASPAQLRGLLVDVALQLESRHLERGLQEPADQSDADHAKPSPSGNTSAGS